MPDSIMPGGSTEIITADARHSDVGETPAVEGVMQSSTIGNESLRGPITETNGVSHDVTSGASGGANRPVVGTSKQPTGQITPVTTPAKPVYDTAGSFKQPKVGDKNILEQLSGLWLKKPKGLDLDSTSTWNTVVGIVSPPSKN